MKTSATLGAYLVCLACSFTTPSSASVVRQLSRDAAEDCSERVDTCRSSSTTFLECPITCAKSLEPDLPMVQGNAHNPEDFYKLSAKRAVADTDGDEFLDFELFDGYITLLAAIPMEYSAMAEHYYQMTEVLASLEAFRSVCIILPFVSTPAKENVKLSEEAQALLNKWTSNEKTGRHCAILEAYHHPYDIADHSIASADSAMSLDSQLQHVVLDYVENKVRRNQDEKDPFDHDKVTLFMVNYDGKKVERRVTPTLDKMKRVLKHYYDKMDAELQ